MSVWSLFKSTYLLALTTSLEIRVFAVAHLRPFGSINPPAPPAAAAATPLVLEPPPTRPGVEPGRIGSEARPPASALHCRAARSAPNTF